MKSYITDRRADYSEMFESIDEYSNKKIPRGTSVVLVGEKIRPACEGELPFGVISSFPIMIGNSGGLEWNGKYLTDEFGNYITEEKEIWYFSDGKEKIKKGLVSDGKIPVGSVIRKKKLKILNPNFDEKKEYIPRMLRNEWNIVGLLGKVKILKNQPVSPNWIKLKDISDNIEEWLIR